MMTLKKIASLAFVSVSTASKALNDSKEVNPETILRVKQIARENGYYSDKKNIALDYTRKETMKIAILCPEIISIHYSAVSTILYSMLNERGLKAEIHICGFKANSIKDAIESAVNSKSVNGIVCLECPEINEKYSIPIVSLSEVSNFTSFCIDYNLSIYNALAYLKTLGHTRIGYIGEVLSPKINNSFYRAIKENDLELIEDNIIINDLRFEECGDQAINTLIKEKKLKVTAFMCAYDEIAFGAMHALATNGLRVPDDISIIGKNDIPISAYNKTSLTTIKYPINKICSRVIEYLINPNKTIEHILFPADLIIRSSVCKR